MSAQPVSPDDVAEAMLAFKRATDTADHVLSERLGINRTDARCLAILIGLGESTPSDLATAAEVAPSAMTHVLDRLERAGHVVRARSDQDRRRVLLHVSGSTQRRVAALWDVTVDEVHAQLAGYSAAERALLLSFLRAQTELQERHAQRLRNESASTTGRTGPRDSEPRS